MEQLILALIVLTIVSVITFCVVAYIESSCPLYSDKDLDQLIYWARLERFQESPWIFVDLTKPHTFKK